MTKEREAMKLALEALEYISSHYMSLPKIGCMALAVVEEALAEPAQQQEPMAYSYTSRITGAQGFSHHPMPRFIDADSWDIKPLYTSSPASKPLTDEQLEAMAENYVTNCYFDTLKYARAIEAAHGITGEQK